MSDCCTPDGSCHTGESGTATTTVAEGQVTEYRLEGVNSPHCQGVVTKALSELDSVLGTEVGVGTGRFTVTTAGDPDDALIERTIDEAGYTFVGRA
ncbi:copper chaperone [Streptomyces sp. AJS327]|uniref:heavy-metal-associated domain-containing protein n=1 Tax=Streptomyces sp. AJS327 TaxID=2545265 RepID=UPI0015E01290|nr:heavy-metal-associated domain-containing protein [Streptomyces sp. AJS327]MBA0053154.1 copper chaperone [Streptomyces sp. AJS327]